MFSVYKTHQYANCFVKFNTANSTEFYNFSVLLVELITELRMFLSLNLC